MEQLKPNAILAFEAELYLHGSWGAQDQGPHSCEMRLYLKSDNTGWIEWENPIQDEQIGLTFDVSPQGLRTLSDYDGVMALPVQACDLLRAAGVHVPFEFDDRFEHLAEQA